MFKELFKFGEQESEKESDESREKKQSSKKHLKENIRPIIACIGTWDQFGEDNAISKAVREETNGLINNKNSASNRNVDYYGDPDDLKNKKYKNAGEGTYVISPLDNLDKFSQTFINCTGVVAAGFDKTTNENISFLSHEDPGFFLRNKKNKEQFIEDLKEMLKTLKEKSVEGTVDAAIFGGNYLESKEFQNNYIESVKLLSKEISEILEFEPIVITGPKETGGNDNIFYDNKNRRLYIIRPEVGKTATESFISSDIENQAKKWRSKK